MNIDRFACKAKDVYGGWVQSDIFESVNGTGFGFAWKYNVGRFQFHPIVPETLCQCTGLRDSDGKLIYENDYLKITGEEGNIEKALVRYDESVMEYVLIFNESETPIRFFQMWMEEGKKCYVVGNKFDKEKENEG